MSGARTFPLGGDARGCRLLPREVRDRRTRMVIRVGNVGEMIGRVNRDLTVSATKTFQFVVNGTVFELPAWSAPYHAMAT